MLIYYFAILLLFQTLFNLNNVQDKTLTAPTIQVVKGTTPHCLQQKNTPSLAANIIFQSIDNGQTWQDISKGLPSDIKPDAIFVDNGELYLNATFGMFRSNTDNTIPDWKKEISFDNRSTNMAKGRASLYSFTSSGHFYQKINNTSLWLPVFNTFKNSLVRTMMETSDGNIFIGCDNGIFKSADNGNTWKHVFSDGWVIQMVESKGVLVCTNSHGILRSSDGGENWDLVISEGGVGIAAEIIDGGFAAITYNTTSKTRRVRTSFDSGKTWQAIDAGLPAHASIASIKQVGKFYFCGHPDGIFRSSDEGKTWELLLPAIDKKVFNLSVSDNVIYAVPRDEGC